MSLLSGRTGFRQPNIAWLALALILLSGASQTLRTPDGRAYMRAIGDLWSRITGRVDSLAAPTACSFPSAPHKHPPSDAYMLEFLHAMYAAHGASAEIHGDWVSVDNGKLFTRASYHSVRQHPQTIVLQADFLTVTDSGDHIVESFAGIGPDIQRAVVDACIAFQDSTFHPLFSVLLARACTHTNTETWEIAGTKRTLVFGGIRVRGDFPRDTWPAVNSALETQLKRSTLPTGLHWVRYFYMTPMDGQPPTIEVLLDNQPWPEMLQAASSLPWPSSATFYSVRLFFLVKDV